MADKGPLTEAEIQIVRQILEHAENIQAQAEYRESVRLVMKTWRGSLVFYAGLIAGFIGFKDQILAMLKTALGIP